MLLKKLHTLKRFPNKGLMAFISSQPKRLGSIEGYDGRKNEIIYHPPKAEHAEGSVIFFGGDVQDYKENMLNHRDNKYHAKRDLESTATLLHERFPRRNILIIKPAKMTLMTFSCYENFLEVNNFGAPTYEFNYDCLKHLKMLLQSVEPIITSQRNLECRESISANSSTVLASEPKIIIGFSKGCVVLNQFLYAFTALNEKPDCDIETLVRSFESMYWLDGGHSGVSSTWVTDKKILQNFSKHKIDVHIHVTPYQVLCDTRPRIGQEERKFRENLLRLGMNVKRVLHFEDEIRSLDMHFKILDAFEFVAES